MQSFSFTENDCTFSLLKVNGAFYTVLHYCFERNFLFVSKADLKKLGLSLPMTLVPFSNQSYINIFEGITLMSCN